VDSAFVDARKHIGKPGLPIDVVELGRLDQGPHGGRTLGTTIGAAGCLRRSSAKPLAPMPSEPFECAEWKTAKVNPDYHVDVDKTFYAVPHRLIGRRVDVRLTYRAVEMFQDHRRIASHLRRSQRGGHITVNEHMPKARPRYAARTPASLSQQLDGPLKQGAPIRPFPAG
jgi:hypothetical protein